MSQKWLEFPVAIFQQAFIYRTGTKTSDAWGINEARILVQKIKCTG